MFFIGFLNVPGCKREWKCKFETVSSSKTRLALDCFDSTILMDFNGNYFFPTLVSSYRNFYFHSFEIVLLRVQIKSLTFLKTFKCRHFLARRILLCLPSCRLRFESWARHLPMLCFNISNSIYNFICKLKVTNFGCLNERKWIQMGQAKTHFENTFVFKWNGQHKNGGTLCQLLKNSFILPETKRI